MRALLLAAAAAFPGACTAPPVERPLDGARAILAPAPTPAPEPGPLARTATYLPDGTRLPPGLPAPASSAHEDQSAHAGHGASDDAAAAFTCPMHPEVRAHEPGACPICGMDLVRADGDGGRR